MDAASIGVVLLGFLAYAFVSGRIAGTVLTAPMLFISFGLLVGGAGLGLVDVGMGHEVIHVVAELTLVLVLFTDASRIELYRLRGDHDLPIRMLVIGLPLVILAGTAASLVVFPEFALA